MPEQRVLNCSFGRNRSKSREIPIRPGAVVERRALTRASDGMGTDVDLSLVIERVRFEAIWPARRIFEVEEVAIPVARLSHIVESKATAGREKDRLFLATHREALDHILSDDDSSA